MPRNELFGWMMFLASGVVFIVIALRSSDWLSLLAGAFWIIGCLAFVLKRN